MVVSSQTPLLSTQVCILLPRAAFPRFGPRFAFPRFSPNETPRFGPRFAFPRFSPNETPCFAFQLILVGRVSCLTCFTHRPGRILHFTCFTHRLARVSCFMHFSAPDRVSIQVWHRFYPPHSHACLHCGSHESFKYLNRARKSDVWIVTVHADSNTVKDGKN